MKIKTKRYYLYYLAKVGGFVINILPLKVALYLANLAGRIAYSIRKEDRKTILSNLRHAFPEKTETEIDRIAKEVFSNLCKNAIELASFRKLTSRTLDRWVKSEGSYEKVDRVFSNGKGIIMLASHFGNWELMPFYFTLRGYKVTAIARRIYFDRYNEFLNGVRTSKGLGVIYRDDSPKKILRVLKRNEMLGILADQDVDSVDGVFVDFFGRQAYTPKAPVAIALATGAPLVPCFLIRENNHHRFIVEDPIELVEKSTKEETIKFNTQKWSRVTESYIRKYPEQWVWMHKRWKTKPEASL